MVSQISVIKILFCGKIMQAHRNKLGQVHQNQMTIKANKLNEGATNNGGCDPLPPKGGRTCWLIRQH